MRRTSLVSLILRGIGVCLEPVRKDMRPKFVRASPLSRPSAEGSRTYF